MVEKKKITKPTDYSNLVLIGGLGVGGYLLYKWWKEEPEPPPGPCTEGEEKCVGYNLYKCVTEKWVLVEKDSPICIVPEEWLPANTELARQAFSVSIIESGWLLANTELARQPFSVTILTSDWKLANIELAKQLFSVTIVGGLQPPKVQTLPAEDITHNIAVLVGKLVDTGYWSTVDVYFQWGKTTSYGNTTPKLRMYEGGEGQEFETEIIGLTAETTYHFRAIVEAVGPRSDEVGPGYGTDKTFTTTAVVKGFTMRVVNAKTGSTCWRAACVAGGTLPASDVLGLGEVWTWNKTAPDYTLDFFVWSGDTNWLTTQSDQFPFRLRDGKHYVWDFAAHEMREE